MDISSKKLPLILIIALLGVLVFQYVSNDVNSDKFVDSTTCEIWVKDPETNMRQYLGEYDSKCLDFKNLNP